MTSMPEGSAAAPEALSSDAAPETPAGGGWVRPVALVLLGVFIFACGAVTGACLMSPRHPPRRGPPPRDLPENARMRLKRHLDLSAEQDQKVDAIMREHFAAMQSVYKEMESRLQPEREALEKKLGEVLTPEQMAQWRALQERQRGAGGPGGGPRFRGGQGGPGDPDARPGGGPRGEGRRDRDSRPPPPPPEP